jgi:hypothetical protein
MGPVCDTDAFREPPKRTLSARHRRTAGLVAVPGLTRAVVLDH